MASTRGLILLHPARAIRMPQKIANGHCLIRACRTISRLSTEKPNDTKREPNNEQESANTPQRGCATNLTKNPKVFINPTWDGVKPASSNKKTPKRFQPTPENAVKNAKSFGTNKFPRCTPPPPSFCWQLDTPVARVWRCDMLTWANKEPTNQPHLFQLVKKSMLQN